MPAIRRPIEPSEAKALNDALSKFSSRPPWTPEKEKRNQALREKMAQLFMDGVSMATLAEVMGWSVTRVNQQIRKCREEGLLEGERNLPAKPPRVRKPSNQRDLTQAELKSLQDKFNKIPRHKHRRNFGDEMQVNWESPEAKKFIEEVVAFNVDRVSIAKCAMAVGMSRAMLSTKIPSIEETFGIGGVKRLPPSAYKALQVASENVPMTRRIERDKSGDPVSPARWIYTRRWNSPEGSDLLKKANQYLGSGYSLDSVAEAVDLEPRQLRRLIRMRQPELVVTDE